MFYFVSKIVWFFLTPSNLLLTFVISGLVLARFRRERTGRILAGAGAAGLLIAGLSPLGNALILPLEQRFPTFTDTGQNITGIIVLGGTFDSEVTNARGQMALNESGERLLALAALAHRYPQARLIYSGGGSEFTPDTTPEATLVERSISTLDVAPARIAYERRSLNTFENAVLSRRVAKPKPDETWLLVTSAFHMPRSVGVFRKAGFEVVPYPVDFRTAGPQSMLRPFGFVGEGLRRMDIATKEWIGLAAYRLAGKTDPLFPAPREVAATQEWPRKGD
ncbi:MAG: YdcF family protein [Micropepsaceae bacterium]